MPFGRTKGVWLGKIIIAYCSASEKNKHSNEEKVALELEKLFAGKGFHVKKMLLAPKKKMGLKEQFKDEKKLQLKEGITSFAGTDFVILGSPTVGSLTSSPLANTLIRSLPKISKGAKKPFFALYSTGIIQGFAIKKMQSLLSMKGITPVESASFTSIFEFDAKKLLEVKTFFERMLAAAD